MDSIEEAYNELVKDNPTWVEPVLKKIDNPLFSKNHFMIDIKDFKEISSIAFVRIYNIKKWDIGTGLITIHCELTNS